MMSGLEWACSLIGTIIGFAIHFFITELFGEDLSWIGKVILIICILGGYELAGFISKRTDFFDSNKKWQIKYEQSVLSYKGILQKLSRSQVEKLFNTSTHLFRSLNISATEAPDELTKMVDALSRIKEEGIYGNLPTSKANKIDSLLYNFSENMKCAPTVISNLKSTAAETGLGFGVIGSATDIALHSALDTLEKKKNLNKATNDANAYIDKTVLELIASIQNV